MINFFPKFHLVIALPLCKYGKIHFIYSHAFTKINGLDVFLQKINFDHEPHFIRCSSIRMVYRFESRKQSLHLSGKTVYIQPISKSSYILARASCTMGSSFVIKDQHLFSEFRCLFVVFFFGLKDSLMLRVGNAILF